MARIKRIVCYAVNGSGLGHVTRLMSTARWLRRMVGLLERRPPEVIFLTSSEATQVLLQAGFASFKLPSKTIVRQTGMDMLEYRRLARQFVWQVLGTFSPDMLVVDTFPSGSFDELLQLLDGPFHKGFVCRRVKPEFAARPIFAAALGLYDAVAVPHAPGPDDNPHAVHGRPAQWCGEVVSVDRARLPDPRISRERLGVAADQKLIYVSAGGGGDSGSREALTQLVEVLGADPSHHVLVGAGPLYQGPRMGGPRLTWFTEPAVAPYLAACDVAVSAGGYNTFHELLHLGVPSVFYAQEKVADDQDERIVAAAAAGACVRIEGVGAQELTQAVAEALRRGPELAAAAKARVPGGGAVRCASALLRGAYTDEKLSWAESVLQPELVEALEAHGVAGQQALSTWLPRLFPAVHVDSLATHPSFVALRSQLSHEALGELDRALGDTDDQAAQRALAARLARLLEMAHALPGGLPDLTGLVDVAMKKHPNASPGQGWAVWLGGLLEQVQRLLSAPATGYTNEERLQIYRIFPKVVDADVAGGFGAFRDVLGAATSQGLSASALIQQIRAVKFAHKRVTLGALAGLSAGGAT
jgi:UDP-N-acetylglucosamine--N-acetylmuramyl-(pentapeptide) pyrophosphoryl-undecaprenol N-acetylglucosamine transferase